MTKKSNYKRGFKIGVENWEKKTITLKVTSSKVLKFEGYNV
jgi:hypothetical protein